jgi:hypothetical protein
MEQYFKRLIWEKYKKGKNEDKNLPDFSDIIDTILNFFRHISDGKR